MKIIKFILLTIFSLLILSFTFFFILEVKNRTSLKTNTYVLEEEYESINIDISFNNIIIYLSENNENKLICDENDRVKYETTIIDGILFIKQNDSRLIKWSPISHIYSKVELYVSKDVFKDLIVKCSTGDITINNGMTFENANIHASTGKITLSSDISNNLEVSTSTGDIVLNGLESKPLLNVKTSTGDINIKDCANINDIKIESSTGDINFTNVNCESLNVEITTGTTKLYKVIVSNDMNIQGSTGDIIFNECDALNINVKLTTGDVKGTLLSSKFFIAKSNTGDVDVPYTREGGECRITVATGDIEISYKK